MIIVISYSKLSKGYISSCFLTTRFQRWVNPIGRKQPYPHDVLYQQCFASLGNMSCNSCPQCNGPGGDEA